MSNRREQVAILGEILERGARKTLEHVSGQLGHTAGLVTDKILEPVADVSLRVSKNVAEMILVPATVMTILYIFEGAGHQESIGSDFAEKMKNKANLMAIIGVALPFVAASYSVLTSENSADTATNWKTILLVSYGLLNALDLGLAGLLINGIGK